MYQHTWWYTAKTAPTCVIHTSWPSAWTWQEEKFILSLSCFTSKEVLLPFTLSLSTVEIHFFSLLPFLSGTCCACSSVKMWLLVDCLVHLSLTLCWAHTHCRYSTVWECVLSGGWGATQCTVSRWGSLSWLSSTGFQAELGDYEPDQPRPLDYISQLTFAPTQNKEMDEKILELHKSHRWERRGSVAVS